MRVQIDSKILINNSTEIQKFSNELFETEFKINRNEWGDLSIVKFDNVKVELVFNDRIYDKRGVKLKREVAIRTREKKKFVASTILVSNKKIHFTGEEENHIDLNKIQIIDFNEKFITLITEKQKYQINTNSLKFNVYLLTLLEWISANNIDEKFEGKKIKFKKEQVKKQV